MCFHTKEIDIPFEKWNKIVIHRIVIKIYNRVHNQLYISLLERYIEWCIKNKNKYKELFPIKNIKNVIQYAKKKPDFRKEENILYIEKCLLGKNNNVKEGIVKEDKKTQEGIIKEGIIKEDKKTQEGIIKEGIVKEDKKTQEGIIKEDKKTQEGIIKEEILERKKVQTQSNRYLYKYIDPTMSFSFSLKEIPIIMSSTLLLYGLVYYTL